MGSSDFGGAKGGVRGGEVNKGKTKKKPSQEGGDTKNVKEGRKSILRIRSAKEKHKITKVKITQNGDSFTKAGIEVRRIKKGGKECCSCLPKGEGKTVNDAWGGGPQSVIRSKMGDLLRKKSGDRNILKRGTTILVGLFERVDGQSEMATKPSQVAQNYRQNPSLLGGPREGMFSQTKEKTIVK